MKSRKTQKGITLIALVITIIVLLILAIVAIGAIKNDGIIQYAQNAKTDYTDASNKEKETLNILETQVEEAVNEDNDGGESSDKESSDEENSDEENKNPLLDDEMFNKKTNTITYDIYGNKIVIPAGFKMLVDDTTEYTEKEISVTKGIVIQDKNGNEFVWVPVGKIYTDEAKTEENSKTITLGRYENFEKNKNGEFVPIQNAVDYEKQVKIDNPSCEGENGITEDIAANHGEYKNVIAKDIGAFCTNSIANCGYYIGRFEAGDLDATKENVERTEETSDEHTVVSKKNQRVYNYITQAKASSLAQNMYKDASTFTSDLINGFAWDTAIIFIQTFGNCENYYNQNFSAGFTNTGITNDKYCNIHDMSGNEQEYDTETYTWASAPCISRGGCADEHNGSAANSAIDRTGTTETNEGAGYSFRPILYF